MQKSLSLIPLLAALAAGCVQPAQPPANHNYDLFGGRYFVEIEASGSFNIKNHVENVAEGADSVKEVAEYEWGPNKLRIEHGVLIFNGKSHGPLEKGDRVHVDKDGHLTVNGKPRP
jgi:hypothetical protein